MNSIIYIICNITWLDSNYLFIKTLFQINLFPQLNFCLIFFIIVVYAILLFVLSYGWVVLLGRRFVPLPVVLQ